MTIGAQIKQRRIELGFSQEHLAYLLQISQPTLSNIETDKSIPHMHLMRHISEILELDPTNVITLQKHPREMHSFEELANKLFERLNQEYQSSINELKEEVRELRIRLNAAEKPRSFNE
jgi:transcriptional regulator with XRE-family HTH domain